MTANYDNLFDAAGRENNVDPRLLKAVFYTESSGNPATRASEKGAQGGMQLLPATAQALGATDTTMEQQVPAAAKYLSQGLAIDGTPQTALKFYFGGPDRAGWGAKTAAYPVTVAQHYAAPYTAVAAAKPAAEPDDAFGQTLKAAPGAPDAFSKSLGGDGETDHFGATLTAPMTPEVQKAEAQKSDSTIASSILRGVHKGLDVPAEAMAHGADWVAKKLGYDTNFGAQAAAGDQAFNAPYDANPMNRGMIPTVARFGGNMLATVPAAMGVGSVIGGAAGLAAANLGRVSPALEFAWNALSPVLSGASQGATVAAQQGEPIGSGAAVGGILGGAGGLVGAGLNKLLISKSPEVAAAVGDYGIPLRAGQVSGSKFVRYLDSQIGNMPGSGQEVSNALQRTAFNRAVGRTFGEDVAQITPQVMQNAKDRIGGVMNGIAGRTTIQADHQLLTELGAIEATAQKIPSVYNDIRPHITDILETASENGGDIPGKAYQALIGHKSALSVAQQSGEGSVRNFANQIREALDEAFQRSAAPGDAAELAAARLQYKNMMTIAPLVNKGHPGDISPLLLQGAANRSFKNNAFRGSGDLGELGDIGQMYLRPPPDSGTATRTAIQSMYGDIKGAARMALGATAGRLAGSVLRADPLSGPAIAQGIPGAIPASVLIRNRLFPGATEQPR